MPVRARLSNARAGARSACRGGASINGQRWHNSRKLAGARVTNAGGDARLGFQISNVAARPREFCVSYRCGFDGGRAHASAGDGGDDGGPRVRSSWRARRRHGVPGAAQGFEAMDARVRPRSGLFPAARPVGPRETRRDSAQEGAMAGARRMRGSTRRLGAQRVFFTGVQRGWAARKHGAARRPCGRGAPFFSFFFFLLFFIFSKTLH